MERLKAFFHGADLIPFFLMAGQSTRLSIPRVIEAIIIAGITGAVVLYGVTLVIGERLDGFKGVYDRDRIETVDWRKHIQSEVDDTQKIIYTHEHKGETP